MLDAAISNSTHEKVSLIIVMFIQDQLITCKISIFLTKKKISNFFLLQIRCSICKKLLPNKYSLRDHISRHKPDSDKAFQCDLCNKKFHVRYDLKVHIKKHQIDKEDIPRSICQECNKT